MMNNRLRRCIAPLIGGWQRSGVVATAFSWHPDARRFFFRLIGCRPGWRFMRPTSPVIGCTGDWMGGVVGGCLLLVRVIKVKGVPLRSVFIQCHRNSRGAHAVGRIQRCAPPAGIQVRDLSESDPVLC